MFWELYIYLIREGSCPKELTFASMLILLGATSLSYVKATDTWRAASKLTLFFAATETTSKARRVKKPKGI